MTSLLKRAMRSFTKRPGPTEPAPYIVAERVPVTAPTPQPAAPPPAADVYEAKNCGLKNEVVNGWFNTAAGELLPGYKITAEDTVLDVGSGGGGWIAFAAATGAEVIATDVDPACVDRIERQLSESKARAHRTLVSDTNPLPLPDATATRVMCLEVLEHVPDPAQFMSELVRVGKPGALYLLTVPDDKAELIQKKIAPPAYWAPPNHIRIFSRPEFEKVVTDAGLIIEQKTYRSFFWAMWWVLFWAADQNWNEKEGPILFHWTQCWSHLLNSSKGDHVRQALDEFMPKSQVIVARKPL